jgi:hypothetical protein
MKNLEVTRNGLTDEFSIVLIQGSDTIRCMVTVASGLPDNEMKRSALSKAKALARALDVAIDDR